MSGHTSRREFLEAARNAGPAQVRRPEPAHPMETDRPRTMDQLVYRAMQEGWTLAPRDYDGYLLIDTPEGQYWFVLDSDGSKYGTLQVL